MSYSFFTTTKNPWSPALGLLLFFQFFGRANAIWEAVFNYNGTDYSVTSLPRDSDSPARETQDKFAANFKDAFANANCGNVTYLNATLNSVISIWNDTVCKGKDQRNLIQFVRAANNFIQETFENCTTGAIQKSVHSTEQSQCPDHTIALIVICSVVGAFFLALFLGATAVCVKTSNWYQERQYFKNHENYYSRNIQSSFPDEQPIRIELEKRTQATDMPDENSPILRPNP